MALTIDERKIETIDFGEAVFLRRGMYLSADDEEALYLGLREIYVNALDALTEMDIKNGKVSIDINSKKRSIIVEDNAGGIPNEIRADGNHSLKAAYLLPHSGSHFNGKAVNAIGLNGIGAKAVAHTSSWFQAISNDGRTCYSLTCTGSNKGAIVQALKLTPLAKKIRGTRVEYIPNKESYHEVWFNEERLKKDFSEMMKFYPKCSLYLNFDSNISEFSFPNGLKSKDTKIYYQSDNLIIALSLNSVGIKPFANRLQLEGGKFFTHFKTLLTKTVNQISGLKLSGEQVQNQFSGYVAIFVDNPLFSNQSKTSIANTEVNTEITKAIQIELEKFSKTMEWNKLIKQLEAEQKAEEAAERARKKVKDALDGIKKSSKKKIIAADKLKDCINSGKGTYLAICEGDSALGSLVQGRDINNVALFPIRGKIINALKNPQEKYLDNEEVQQICSILGCGIFNDYNSKNLKYDKVLIAVDSDYDGHSIATLLMTLFYVIMPQFIKEGRLLWMKAPLYYNADTNTYIFEEADWASVKNKKGFIRAKGLGELETSVVEDALFGQSKRWEILQPRNWQKFGKLIEDLMGKDVETRRDYIFSNVDFERIKFL